MLDTVVIGGGFWGTACASKLSTQGREVLLIDSKHENAASRAAAGIVCLHWYKQETILKMLPAWWSTKLAQVGFEWLEAAGLRHTGENFLNQSGKANRGKYEPKLRKDCYLIPSCSAVLSLYPRQQAEVETLCKVTNGWQLKIKNSDPITARNVVIAAGVFTDELLRRSGMPLVGVKPLIGRAMVAQVSKDFTTPLTVMTRPYTQYTLRPWGDTQRSNQVRLGDTVEKSDALFQKNNETLIALFQQFTAKPKVVNILKGFRPVRDKIIADLVDDGLIVATGGHRVGLCLAGGVAHHVAGLLR